MVTDQIMILQTYRHYASLAIKSRLKRIWIINMKKCSNCFQEKLISEYNSHSRNADGLQAYCKQCYSAYYKAYNASMKASHAKVVPQSKVCRDCGLERPIGMFGKRSVSPDKHNIYCKPCWRERSYKAFKKASNVR